MMQVHICATQVYSKHCVASLQLQLLPETTTEQKRQWCKQKANVNMVHCSENKQLFYIQYMPYKKLKTNNKNRSNNYEYFVKNKEKQTINNSASYESN